MKEGDIVFEISKFVIKNR